MVRLLPAVLLVAPCAAGAAQPESLPVQVKVSGFVRGTCRIEAVGQGAIVQPACNVPWSMSRNPRAVVQLPESSNAKAVARVTITPNA